MEKAAASCEEPFNRKVLRKSSENGKQGIPGKDGHAPKRKVTTVAPLSQLCIDRVCTEDRAGWYEELTRHFAQFFFTRRTNSFTSTRRRTWHALDVVLRAARFDCGKYWRRREYMDGLSWQEEMRDVQMLASLESCARDIGFFGVYQAGERGGADTVDDAEEHCESSRSGTVVWR